MAKESRLQIEEVQPTLAAPAVTIVSMIMISKTELELGDVSVIRKNCMNENDSYIKQCGHDNMTHTTVLTNNKV